MWRHPLQCVFCSVQYFPPLSHGLTTILQSVWSLLNGYFIITKTTCAQRYGYLKFGLPSKRLQTHTHTRTHAQRFVSSLTPQCTKSYLLDRTICKKWQYNTLGTSCSLLKLILLVRNIIICSDSLESVYIRQS